MKRQRRDIGRGVTASLGTDAPVPGSSLTAAAQTRLSWAHAVESYEALPETFRAAFDRLYPQGIRSFPYAVLTPTREGFLYRAAPKLIWGLDDTIYILEQQRGRMLANCYAYGDISYAEVGKVLLRAWIAIHGRDGDGRSTAVRVEYNAVNDHLFDPFLARMRATPASTGDAGNFERERAKFDFLEQLNYKFMNYGRRSIRPGDRVTGCLFQPEIRAPILSWFGRSVTRSVASAHLVMLTDGELIVLQDPDGASMRSGQAIRYGVVWSYIPLGGIDAATIMPRGDNLLALSLALRHDVRIDWLFTADKKRDLAALLSDRSQPS